MDKRDFFMLCMSEGKYRLKPWVLRAFALVRETKTVEEMAFFDILQSPAGYQYKDSATNGLLPLTGYKKGEPLFHPKEKLFVKKGELPGILKDEETDYGRILYYCMVFLYPFDGAVPFVNGPVSLRDLEDKIAANFEDDVDANLVGDAQPTAEVPGKFYPRQLLKYYEGAAYSRGLAMLFVPAASMKSMKVAPEVIKRRDELFSDPKIDMNDQAVAASVEAELVALDKKSFEGDSASGFLINKKDFQVIRKKRFISFGSGAGLTPDSRTPYIKRSLTEGTDLTQIKAYNDESRAGSYKRGVETMFGGELDKWLVRESSNIRVTEDCGSTIGIPSFVTDFNKNWMLGLTIVNGKAPLLLTQDNIGTYMGKMILRRSPATCRAPAPDFCSVCLGKRLSMNPDAISIAFSQYGHDFMGESMSAMHGKALTVARMDFVSEAS